MLTQVTTKQPQPLLFPFQPNTEEQVIFALTEAAKIKARGGTEHEADDKFDEVMSVGATISPVAGNIQWAMDELEIRGVDFCETYDFLEELSGRGVFADHTTMQAAINERFGLHQVVELTGKKYRYQRYDNYRVVNQVCSLGLDWAVEESEKEMVVSFVEHGIQPRPPVDLSWLDDTEEYPVFLFDAVDMYDLTDDQLEELIEESNRFVDYTRLLEDNPVKIMSRLLHVNKGAYSLVPKQIEVNTPDTCRFVRGQVIAQRGGVAQISEHEFRVKSCKGNGFYNVIKGRFDSARCTSWHCNCRDTPVNEGCKHIWAVLHTEALSDYFDNEWYQIPEWAKTEELSRWPYVEYQL